MPFALARLMIWTVMPWTTTGLCARRPSGCCGSSSSSCWRRPCSPILSSSIIRYFGLDGTFGFDAWFGFASCVVLIVFAKGLGAAAEAAGHLLRRAEPRRSCPSLLLIGGGLVLPLLRGPLRAAAVLVLPLLALGLVWQVPDGVALAVPLPRLRARARQGDKLSRLFATIFSLMAFARRAVRAQPEARPSSCRPPFSTPAPPSAWRSPATW